MNGIKLWSVTWETTTAGPSPHGNNRTEVFFLGCNKAIVDKNPCKGCFNTKLWNPEIAEKTHDPKDMVEQIVKYAPNKYVTIGGGEPTDQLPQLVELAKGLKSHGFHIMVYTWKDLQKVLAGERGPTERSGFTDLLQHIDILVDGEFVMEERLYQDNGTDGTFNSIGSGNQAVWDVKAYQETGVLEGYSLRDIKALALKQNNDLVYLTTSYDVVPKTAVAKYVKGFFNPVTKEMDYFIVSDIDLLPIVPISGVEFKIQHTPDQNHIYFHGYVKESPEICADSSLITAEDFGEGLSKAIHSFDLIDNQEPFKSLIQEAYDKVQELIKPLGTES